MHIWITNRSSFKIFFVLMILIKSAPAVFAEGYSFTSTQLYYGTKFNDRIYGDNTIDGKMFRITLEHYGTWKYGDNYFFIHFTSGDFVDFQGNPTGLTNRIYSEWAPRLSISKITGKRLSFSVIKDFLIAGQINRGGDGFEANLFGIGFSLNVPQFTSLNINMYYRNDDFNQGTYQVTSDLSLPFNFGSIDFSFDGYIDIAGTDNNGTDILTQPKLLADIGSLLFNSKKKLEIGVEWYLHHNKILTESVLQATMKWTW